MTGKARTGWLAGVGAAAMVLALAAGCGVFGGPAATPTPDFWELAREYDQVMGARAINPAPATPYPDMFMWVYAVTTRAAPPPRPTHDPLWPGNYPVGMVCEAENLDTSWPSYDGGDPELGIDFSAMDDCFSDTTGYTITLGSGTVISMPVAINIPPEHAKQAGSGTDVDPYSTVYLPEWLDTDTYRDTFQSSVSGAWYWGIYYDALQGYMEEYIAEAGAHFAADPDMYDRISVVRVRVGPGGESAPIYTSPLDTETSMLTQHQAGFTSCTDYLAYIYALKDAATAAFPDKPVVVMSNLRPGTCVYEQGATLRMNIVRTAVARSEPAGLSQHMLKSSSTDFDSYAGMTYENWRRLTSLRTANATAMPAFAEFGDSAIMPSSSWVGSGGDDWREWYWATLMGFGAQADWVGFNATWSGYMTTWGLWVADCMSNEACAAIYFHDLEQPIWTFPGGYPSYGYGDYRGDLARNVTLANATAYPQSCRPALATAARGTATAIAGASNLVYTPLPCYGDVLPTPAMTLIPLATPHSTIMPRPTLEPTAQVNMLQRLADRQARYIQASTTMTLTISDGWSYADGIYGDTDFRLIYLDNHTDVFTVTWPSAPAVTASHPITGTDSGDWTLKSWTGALYTDGSITIANGASQTWLHMLGMSLGDEATPTPTPTSLVTQPPTLTPTATRTSTPTRTPTSTSTPATGEISGVAYHDADGDRVYDPGETLLEGSTITLYYGFTLVEADSDVSAVDGSYALTGISPGNYTLRVKTPPAGYTSDFAVYLAVAAGSSITLNAWHDLVATPTSTPIHSPTATATRTATSTRTASPTATSTPTSSLTPTASLTPTSSPTASSTPTPTSTSTGTPTTGEISGVAYHDADGDRVYDPGETLLEGSTITLYYGFTLVEADSDDSAVDGSYALTGISPGNYTIRMAAPPAGYTSGFAVYLAVAAGSSTTLNAWHDLVATPTSTPIHTATSTATRTLTPTRTPTRTPTASLTPTATGSPTSTPTASITPTSSPTATAVNAQVAGLAYEDVDLDRQYDVGEPLLADAEIVLYKQGLSGVEYATATSGVLGVYTFAGVPNGWYVIREKTAPPGYQLSGYSRYFRVDGAGVAHYFWHDAE